MARSKYTKRNRRYRGISGRKMIRTTAYGPGGSRIRTTRMTKKLILKPLHYFKRTTSLSNIANFVIGTPNAGSMNKTADACYFQTSGAGTAGVGAHYYFPFCVYFTLDMLPDYNELQVLFDAYKICGASIKFVPFSTQQPAASTTVIPAGATKLSNQPLSLMIHTVIDKDDATAISPSSDAGLQLLRQYDTYKQRYFFSTKPHKWYIRPNIAMAAYKTSGVFTGYARVGPKWLDMQNPDIPHYGLKGMFHMFVPSDDIIYYASFRPEVTLYLQCKDVR